MGGPAYIAALLDGVPRSTNVAHYAGIVAERALMRGMIEAAEQVKELAPETATDNAVIGNLQVDPTGHSSPGMRRISFDYWQVSAGRYPAVL